MLQFLGDDGALFAVGLGGGLLLGLAARLGRFCTLGAIEDFHYGNDPTRMRMWGVALGTAILVSFAAMAAGFVDAGATVYLGAAGNLLGAALGGLAFGYGMAMAGNCGYGALARLGGGDLRSFVIALVLGLAAYATLSGPLAAARIVLFAPDPWGGPEASGMAHALEAATGLPAILSGMAFGALLLAGSAFGPGRRPLPGQVAWGVVVGAAVASGYVGTQLVLTHGFSSTPVYSHSFAAPVGEAVLYVMTSSGGGLSFGIGSVAGVVAGSFIGSLFKGRFRWEACEDPRELRRQLLGAALMGWGAVTAGGCSVGQGLSAFALLAVTAPITLAAIWLGAAVGLRQLILGFRAVE